MELPRAACCVSSACHLLQVLETIESGKGSQTMAEGISGYGCGDYRQEMVLNGLRRRLQQENLSEEDKEALRQEILRLEEDMGLD